MFPIRYCQTTIYQIHLNYMRTFPLHHGRGWSITYGYHPVFPIQSLPPNINGSVNMPKGSTYEREVKKVLEELGYLVIRSAGSMGEGDLIAISPPPDCYAYPIEVKSTNKRRFNVSNTKKDKEQYHQINQKARLGYPYTYIIRWKGFKEHIGLDLIDKMTVYPIWIPEDYYLTQSNQQYPSFWYDKGLKVRDVFIDYSKTVENLTPISNNYNMRGFKT